MKTAISFVMVAFLILLGSAKSEISTALQPNENLSSSGSPDRTISHRFQGGYWSPLVCDGVEIDILEGTLDVHCVMHYENGVIAWMIMRYTGTLTGPKTKEVFEIKEVDMSDLPKTGIISFHSNIKGSNGSHIISAGTINTNTWELTWDKSVCN